MDLVIVESPTKAKTIGKFLPKGFTVMSSFGHIRDLPKSKMGIDIENGFIPKYVIPRTAQKHVTELKKRAKKIDTLWLATDLDREGEAISWHLLSVLGIPADRTKRIVFHEITKTAITEAMEHPRSIDQHLVDAQQARRILDRLVGYELSPFLWKKVARGLSAGRVQSVALRLIVEREREIQAFVPQEYWSLEGVFDCEGSTLEAKLYALEKDGKAMDKFAIPNAARAGELAEQFRADTYKIDAVTDRGTTRSPQPPFTTSTLQQEANTKLGLSSKQTMYYAQQLYEGVEIGTEGSIGLITYMRTDSVHLSDQFLEAAQGYITATYGEQYATGVRQYKTKQKQAQEAHEAIRPTDVLRPPASLKGILPAGLWKLYDLVWRRAVASQLPNAKLTIRSIDIGGVKTGGIFRLSGTTIDFDGFLKLYSESFAQKQLPAITVGKQVAVATITPQQHFTEPPARYTEAAFVKKMEELGIGRPSTYAPTVSTLIDRNYIAKEDRKLKPSELAFLVNDLLVEHFPSVVDYQFTANMEDDLDSIAAGSRSWQEMLQEFYTPFKENLDEKEKTLTKESIIQDQTDAVCEKCGKPMAVKFGRFGKFLACTGYPECKNTKPMEEGGDTAKEAEPAPAEACEKCGKPMIRKVGRFGPFFACSGYPDCKNIKSITKSTGVGCPACAQGDIVERRSKRGKPFYSCSRYPDCDFALWQKPTGEKCPRCGSLVVFAAKGKIRCSQKECSYETAGDGE